MVVVTATTSACGSDGSTPEATAAPTVSASAPPLERLSAYYNDPILDPSRDTWGALLADTSTGPISLLEFIRLRPDDGALANYDAYLEAWLPAATANGADPITVHDTLMPGLEGLDGYEHGVAWVATFPSIQAYVDAMLDEAVVAASALRRQAVDEAQILAGPNLVPDFIKQLPPNEPASAFPSDRLTGKTTQQVVDELLAVYPSGGADPTRSTLEAMLDFEGAADQRIHYINLYEFNDAADGGAAALGEYNAEALPFVLAHGARPKVLADVTHHLVGPTPWDRFIVVSWPSFAVFTDLRLEPGYIEAQKSRLASADRYGNLIMIARADAASGAP